MKLFHLILITFAVLFANMTVSAQEEEERKPLELPNYVIEGKGQINVRSGVKQYPGSIEKLTQSELDSINSLQKEQTVLLPPKPLPENILTVNKRRGFLKGSFDSFLTPYLEGGYNFAVNDYKMFANAKLETSGGDAINSEYFKLFGGINSEYLAPEKFFIFGGSKTNSDLHFSYNNYNLYAERAARSRSAFNVFFSVDSKGNYEGSDFQTGGHYSFLNVSTAGNSIGDHGVNAYLHFNNYWKTFIVGAGAKIDYHSLDGNSMSYFEIAANGKYYLDKFIFKGDAGVQFANTTSGATLFNFLVNLDAKYMLNKDFSFYGYFKNTMENSNFQQYYGINPYISDTTYFDFPLLTEIAAQANYHPDDNLLLAVGLSFGLEHRNPYFENADTATFLLRYGNSTNFGIFSEGNWQFAKADRLIYHFRANMNYIKDKMLPYSLPLQITAIYQRDWTDEIITSIGLNYVASRYADLDNKIELPDYFDLFLRADYNLNKKFNIFIKVNNMLNENIYIWRGYREKGLFFAAGMLYSF
jgi:hypothetical protein